MKYSSDKRASSNSQVPNSKRWKEKIKKKIISKNQIKKGLKRRASESPDLWVSNPKENKLWNEKKIWNRFLPS